MEDQKNSWETLQSQEKYNNNWIQVFHEDVINPAGKKGIYGKVHFKNKAIGIVPIDENGYTWLVGQWRYPINEYSWEIPEGGSPIGEDIYLTAARELQEETGIQAKEIKLLKKIHVSNSVTDEVGYLFVAKKLSFGDTEFEDTEDITVKKIHIDEAMKMVLNDEITDSLSVIGIMHVYYLR